MLTALPFFRVHQWYVELPTWYLVFEWDTDFASLFLVGYDEEGRSIDHVITEATDADAFRTVADAIEKFSRDRGIRLGYVEHKPIGSFHHVKLLPVYLPMNWIFI